MRSPNRLRRVGATLLWLLAISGSLGSLKPLAADQVTAPLELSIPSRAPLLRDIKTGYLLNCAFRAIRPYIWRQEPRLSGWDTDRSGGGWEETPSGFFPNDFAFNVESFRLHDTNGHRSVTIRHQIAHQAAGKVTWEFRFQLPGPMEGAAWQLGDLDNAAVRVSVHEGHLWYDTAARPVPLAAIEPNHEYGVRVVADLDRKRASIRVDGELKAKAAPLLESVKGIDYVLITTGDTAVGDLLLPHVSLHIGYAVCETFISCGEGGMPGDWLVERRGGTAAVEAFACAAKPDVLSLKLTGGARASKRFESQSGAIQYEFRFLLPEPVEGAFAELLRGKARGARIVTLAGDICYLGPAGKAVPIVRNFRPNLWYDIRLLANPKTGQADIFVNGKLAQRATDVCPAGISFDAVRFGLAGNGTLWVDDVRVSPWEEPPSDYVPAPQPPAHKGPHLLGALSCSLWKEGNAYAGWDYVVPFAPRRKPYLGWYDDGSPEVADWEIKWQVEHGIDFEVYCWYRPNDAVNHPIKDGVLEQGIREGLFNARYSALKKFAIMYTNQGAGDTNPEDWRKHIIPYWIEYFFKDPRYLKIDGKPVLSIYFPDNFLRDFGGVQGCKQATDLLRSECLKAGFPGITILMELRSSDASVMKTMKAIGIDYCYAYTWGTGDVARQRQNNLAQRDAAAGANFNMLPSVSVGWQTSPWDGTQEVNGWASVPDYGALARWARDDFMPSLPAGSLGQKMLLLPNWNEFGEGHFIMPSNLAGFGYVDALREVFTAGGPHEDRIPTAGQKRRFTILYPRD